MELRVWVDGTQRVVCGVKLTTTCQEIVFALAHATQQAGRFTMIERWRNNERLLSPNEQPLVTLQRWGDRMNEVEFILRKTSTDPMPLPQTQQPSTNNLPQSQQQQQQQVINNDLQPTQQHSVLNQKQNVITRTSTPSGSTTAKQPSQQIETDPNTRQQTITNGGSNQESPVPGHVPLPAHQTPTQQLLTDQAQDNLYQQQRQYNLSQRSHTSLGPLTSSNSALNLTSNQFLHPVNRIENVFRSSLSSSALPNQLNGGNVTQSNPVSMVRPCYTDDKPISPSLYNSNNNSHNGYAIQNDTSRYVPTNSNSMTKNYPYEDLYSTINKKRTSQPPAVPAKPRLVSNLSHPQQSMNNAQVNYYHPGQSPVHMFAPNLRPRHPPGYMEYLEAMANRNSLPASLISNPNYIHQVQSTRGNMFPRSSYDLQNHHLYSMQQQQNGSSPANSAHGNQYYYQTNRQANRQSFGLGNELSQQAASMQSKPNQINPKLIDSGLVINRGSAVNIKLPPNSQVSSHNQSSLEEQRHDTSTQSNVSSVSQMGLDMLKVIEEQKKLLLNQKNELERLDHDQEYFEAKQNSEQAELINRIEKEIVQLETLWRENQAQIKKLENQDFERELELLKAERVRMEKEIDSQKKKLARFEDDIAQCKGKIEQLESELNNLGVQAEEVESIVDDNQDLSTEKGGSSNDNQVKEDSKPGHPIQKLNIASDESSVVPANPSLRDSKDDDDEDDSGGDTSDDLKSANDSNNKLRSAKDVASVEKRGLINGIRSLKLDKTRAINRSNEKINSAENASTKQGSSMLLSNHLMHKDQVEDPTHISNDSAASIIDSSCSKTNGQNDKSTAAANNNSINKYEFLMTL